MKTHILKLFFAATLVLTSAGCAQHYPPSAFLDLSVPPQHAGVYDGTITANITGYDNRSSRALIFYYLGDETVAIPSVDPLQKVIVQSLGEGFSSQGLIVENNGKVHIGVNIDTMAVKVTKNTWTYETVTGTNLIVTITNPQGEFTKKFTREAQETSFFKPEPPELEKVASEQISGLIETILKDKGISDAVQTR